MRDADLIGGRVEVDKCLSYVLVHLSFNVFQFCLTLLEPGDCLLDVAADSAAFIDTDVQDS